MILSTTTMVVILMGVSGSGKTTLGLRLAADLGWTFFDAEDFHDPQTLERMARGELLSDQEMQAWQGELRAQVVGAIARGENLVLAYTGLRHEARRQLAIDAGAVRFVYLKGTATLVRRRLRYRSGIFVRENLLVSQFAALEEPPDAVTIDIDERPGRIVDQIRQALSV